MVFVASLVAALHTGVLPELPYGRYVGLLEPGNCLMVDSFDQLGPLLVHREQQHVRHDRKDRLRNHVGQHVGGGGGGVDDFRTQVRYNVDE